LVPVALALYLLAVYLPAKKGPFRVMGWDLTRPLFDWGWGFLILAGIGIPGIGFYLLAKNLGINTTVQPANLTEAWWTVPVLIGLAAKNAILEEILMVGYLFTRWKQTGGRLWTILVISAVVRGGYHLYQGFGGFAGNLIMGLVFGWLFLKFKRVGPLVVAHFLLDVFAFVGYALLAPYLAQFGI
ncbi:MAG: CPBP family intramembrane metalloprotease domain-containing protein, partial [Propionibacterium sp.]